MKRESRCTVGEEDDQGAGGDVERGEERNLLEPRELGRGEGEVRRLRGCGENRNGLSNGLHPVGPQGVHPQAGVRLNLAGDRRAPGSIGLRR